MLTVSHLKKKKKKQKAEIFSSFFYQFVYNALNKSKAHPNIIPTENMNSFEFKMLLPPLSTIDKWSLMTSFLWFF